jgi:large subunit ribosomal protein L10
MKRSEKPIFVENLAAELKEASSVVMVDYSGLSVKLQQELKTQLSGIGAKLLVVKNTLFRLASQTAGLPKEISTDSVLSGPNALIITEADPIAPIQVLAKFAKEFEIPRLKVGVVEGSFQTKEALAMLSTLPSKDALFAQVLGTAASPVYGIVGALEANIQKLLFILDQKVKNP